MIAHVIKSLHGANTAFGVVHHLIYYYYCCCYTTSAFTTSYSFSTRSIALWDRTKEIGRRYTNNNSEVMENTDIVPSSPVKRTLSDFLTHVYDHTVALSSAVIEQAYSTTTKSLSSKYHYHIVVGNQAGDCDSIISALTYAYIQQQHQQVQSKHSRFDLSTSSLQPRKKLPDDNVENSYLLYIPLIPFPREDMVLRHDVTLLLSHCGVQNLHELLFVNDSMVTDYILQPQNLEGITLVDHNNLQSNPYLRNHSLSSCVVEILDHHLDEGEHIATVTNRNIAFHNGLPTVGSCCTLVGERLLHYYGSARDDPNQIDFELDPGVSLALLGTIVLDTINMDKLANRGTPRDQNVIDQLMYHTNWSSELLPHITDFYSASNDSTSSPLLNNQPLLSLQRIHKKLSSAKFDPTFWNELSVIDCLRMDYKEFQSNNYIQDQGDASSFGISSILIPLHQLEKKDRFLEQIYHFIHARKVKLLAVMSLSFLDTDGKKVPQREIMIITFNQKASDTMIAALLDPSSMLQLTEFPEQRYNQNSHEVIIRKFLQGNISISRKGIAPIMLKCKF